LTVVSFHLGGKAIGLLAPASTTDQDRECAGLRRHKQDGAKASVTRLVPFPLRQRRLAAIVRAKSRSKAL
jgi:hypothetical protein